MNKFIYALNSKDRDLLMKKGYRELFQCTIAGNKAYAFQNYTNENIDIATFSNDEGQRFLVSDVAFFNMEVFK